MQARSSPSNNSWIPEKTGNLLGKTNSPGILPTVDQVDIIKPATRADTTKNIGYREKFRSSCGRENKRKSAKKLEPL